MTRKKRVTLNDVARECGLSPSTVSRVLNGSILVGDERRKLILETARRLQYQKRTIRKQESRAILNIKLFLPVTRDAFVHMFYDVAELVEGMHEGCGEVKVNIIVKLNQEESEAFANKKLGDIDGCVFAFTDPDEKLLKQIDQRNIPVLLINRKLPRYNYVKYDDEACMTALLEKIIAKRGKVRGELVRPCFIGFPPVASINRERKKGVVSGCERYGISFRPDRDVFEFDAVKDIPHDFMHTLHKRGYNAVICFNDMVALSVYQAAQTGGFSFPDDFSLTGFDDSPVQEFLPQRINTIRFNVAHLGMEAGKWLKNRIIRRDERLMQHNLVGEYVDGDTI